MTCVDKTVFLYLFVVIAICEAQSDQYNNYWQKNPPKVEALYPKGFRVTLEDDSYAFFWFSGKINKEFKKLSVGDINELLTESKDGSWVYENHDAKLEVGDKIFYWIYALKTNLKEYILLAYEYSVSEIVKEDLIDRRHNTLPQDCQISKTKVQGYSNICKDQLIFNEEFAQTNLKELKKWHSIIQFPTEPDYPFNVYIPDNTVSFEEGSFVITPVLTESQHSEGFLNQFLDLGASCTGNAGAPDCMVEASGGQIVPPVTTAKITTRRSFNFKFGRVEVRAKLPCGSWLTPEINLEPSDNVYGPHNYESGLMRIAFIRGNPGLAKKLYGGPVLTNSEPYRSLLMQEKIGIDNWYKDYHNYTMIWRPDGIDLLVDGELYGTVDPDLGFSVVAKKYQVDHASHWKRGTVMAPLDQMFHLTLGLRVGGVNDFADKMEGKPWRNRASKAMLQFWRKKDSWHPSWCNGDLRVDYVRVYAL